MDALDVVGSAFGDGYIKCNWQSWDKCGHPLERPGIGVEVNEAFLREHPVIEGPGYV